MGILSCKWISTLPEIDALLLIDVYPYDNFVFLQQAAAAYGTQAPAVSTGGYDYSQTAAAGGQAGSYSNGAQSYGQQAASAQQPAYSSYGQTATTDSSYGQQQQCKRIINQISRLLSI